MILILSTACITLCDLSKKYFSVTIVSMTGNFELSKTVLTTSYISSIKYDPINIVGYKFVGWEDNTKIESSRKLRLKDKNKSFIS